MGQLFWKFLLAFWLALILAFGAVFTLNQLSQSPEQNRALVSPQGRFFLQNAQQLIDAGGVSLLRTLVQNWQDDPMAREQLLVLDASGADLLGRAVPTDIGHNPRAKHLVVQAAGQPLQLVLVNKDNFWQQRAFAIKERLSPRDGGTRERGGPPPLPPFWFHPLFLLMAVIVTSIAASLGLAWYFAAPVRQLKQALSELPKQQWQTQLSSEMTGRRDEFGALARSFNQMAQQVYQAIVSQRRLLHDVSHELRSPLARLQLLTGLVRQHPADLEMALEKIEAEAVRLDQLVGEILTFSRLESGEVQAQISAVAVDELLDSICADATLEAHNRQQQLVLAHNPPATVQADAELLFRALENVVRNAIKYAGSGATIRVSSVLQQQELRICVTDNGPGVAPELLPLLFNPFFRADKQTDGVGLGLSIALRAVAACGGRISADNLWLPADTDAGELRRAGLMVEICLPCRPPS
jgi:two-component system OmpR family sensor kinase